MAATTTTATTLARPLFLLGMMGAGKSRVGRELADRTQAVFIDLDRRIERMFARTIPVLFELGEPYFRACERSALLSLCDEPGFAGASAVVATGGGIVVDRANLDTMGVGDRVYLEVEPETLVGRLSDPAERGQRPLLGDELDPLGDRVRALLGSREQDYRRADYCVSGAPEPGAVAASILARLADTEAKTTLP